jgi:UDP-N-acetyl-D-glucosamine dehydrogenase
MKVSVVGQGYVGLNLSTFAAKAGHEVVGYDINANLISNLRNGITHVPGISRQELLSLIEEGKFNPSNNEELIQSSEVIIIAVPTPLGEDRQPDLTLLRNASQLIAKNARSGAVVINESTSFPGTLRNFIRPLVEGNSKVEIHFAAAPERVDPGNPNWNLANTPRIISGLSRYAIEIALEFYSSFCQEVNEVANPEVAEMAKLFENTFRQVNIALANEFSEIAYKFGLSANEVITAAATKPFGYTPFFPSIGVGGHCIPVDPAYLSFAANELGLKTNFIDLANEYNLMVPKKVASRIKDYLGGSLKNMSIQIAGIAYKPNVSDIRESPVIQLINSLEDLGASVAWYDPLVGEINGIVSKDLQTDIDLGIIATPHDVIDFSIWQKSNIKVIDLSISSKSYGWPKFL